MLPEECRNLRQTLKWSQESLARRANVSPSTIKGFEGGGRKLVRANLAAIERALTLRLPEPERDLNSDADRKVVADNVEYLKRRRPLLAKHRQLEADAKAFLRRFSKTRDRETVELVRAAFKKSIEDNRRAIDDADKR